MPINEDHHVLNLPSKNIKLWRYMDIAAFFSFLFEESLTFVRADLMEDRFEGTFPRLTATALNQMISERITAKELSEKYSDFAGLITNDKTNVFLNCWCSEQTQMVHMWKIYSKEHGIAIESTYEDLKAAALDTEPAYPTEIKYLDYDKERIDWKSNSMSVFTIKRREYKAESEFRLIVMFPRQIEDQVQAIAETNSDEAAQLRKHMYDQTKVLKYKVDLKRLVKRIHISPFAPEWYGSLVKTSLDRLGFIDIQIVRSEL